MIKQRTIARVVTSTGIGLHKGEKVEITLRPAPENTGVIFRRIDLEPAVEFRLDPDLVGDTQLCTCLISESGVRLSTTEHLVAAIAALGIDNLIVDLDAPEVPIMDGSSLPFIYLLQKAGLKEQVQAKQFIQVLETVRVEQGDKWAEISPFNGFFIDFTIAFDHPAIANTAANFAMEITPETFIHEISRARTFGFMRDLEYLHSNNLALGGSMDNAVVLDEFRVLNPDGLRYQDEFVKHKVLDAIGDLFMSGKPLLGKVSAFKSGHALNNLLLRKLIATPSAWRLVSVDQEDPTTVQEWAVQRA